MRLFVAGATGAVGFELVKLAKASGHPVRALTRSRENARKLAGFADEIEIGDVCVQSPSMRAVDIVVSALGAPVTMGSPDRRRFHDVDFRANAKLLEAAVAGGARRFVYVAAHVEPGYRGTAYVRAHEEFVELLRRAPLTSTVVRPTGIYSAFHDFVRFAQRGMGTVIGDGSARTNPIHQADVAARILAHLESGPAEESVGGPDVVSRRQIVEMAFHAIGKRPRIISVPGFAFGLGAKMAGVGNPRVGELLEFVGAVSVTDCVAPALGKRRLEDYFRELAG